MNRPDWYTDNMHKAFCQALVHPSFSHVSSQEWCRVTIYNIYHRADTPTGVLAMCGGPKCDEVLSELQKYQIRISGSPEPIT